MLLSLLYKFSLYIMCSHSITCIQVLPYVIILCLVSNFFAYSIKFIHGYYLPHDFLLYMSLSTIFLI